MKYTKLLSAASLLAVGAGLVSCSQATSEQEAAADAGVVSSEAPKTATGTNYVTALGNEPLDPLIPADTYETGGTRILNLTNSNLLYVTADGKLEYDLAESVETEDNQHFTVKLREGIVYSDGSPILAQHFVNTWSHAVENSYKVADYFEPIVGYEDGKPLQGLKVIDDRTFTIELSQPESSFLTRLTHWAYVPWPDEALADPRKAGEKPVASGPYKLAEWNHDQDALVVPNEKYTGPRKISNDGIRFIFYPTVESAYADLLADNVDVLDGIPDNAFATFEQELDGRFIKQPDAVFNSFTIPQRLAHFSGEEGRLRRYAISHALNRKEITDTIFAGVYQPVEDFASPAIPNRPTNLAGTEVLNFDVAKAKEYWAKANEISPWEGTFKLSYNADGGHQAWVEAVLNQISNNLGIETEAVAYPDFKSLLEDMNSKKLNTAVRTSWGVGLPLVSDFLAPLYKTDAPANYAEYSNPKFDELLVKANGAKTQEEITAYIKEAEEILFADLPVIPLWNRQQLGGYSSHVSKVELDWSGGIDYAKIVKK
ncbi:ABC transporter substrate-binding protein [Corynebacterium sp. HS2168-gen11]|uniref:peptide ABC transporter substrate-binding protein n=1 Tax=Corynebacterium sp. HS2168-gen11 TaxID=2974027 RepID=UPI00216B2F4A|nr:ABC transporter substrate-binding protein [Corynebacterium sp. HS2168-gen11]MCS4534942.1 ABC transporter substrate-binding protein [Corynebacterium sp. HS2168-gen11]